MGKSHHIRSRAASRFFKATKHSEEQATPLNRLVTLNLSHTTCPEQAASAAVASLIAKFGRWLRHQSKKIEAAGRVDFGPPAYSAVLEAPGGINHAHWLVYVPPELENLFIKTLPKWLEKTAGTIVTPVGAIDVTPIDTIMALSRYCMKGVEKHHAKRCFVRPVDQGVVWGKRVLISRSLGATARARARRVTVPGRSCATGSASPAGLTMSPVPLKPSIPIDYTTSTNTGGPPF